MLNNKPFWFSLALIAVYLLLGYFAAPLILQPRLEQYFATQLGRELRFEKLRFDPITWSVQLSQVRSDATEQGLFPGVALTADAIQMRFNFWRFEAAISELKVQAPILIIDAHNTAMQSGRYPFFTYWQQWQSSQGMAGDSSIIPVSRWRLDGGRLSLRAADGAVAEKILLDEVFLKTGKMNDTGTREFSLVFATAKESEIRMQGTLDPIALSGNGQYQYKGSFRQQAFVAGSSAALTDQPGKYEAKGAFKVTSHSNELLIELADSQLSAQSRASCVFNGLLCAVIQPIQASFEATLLTATDAVHLKRAVARMWAFQLDSSMAQGKVELIQKMEFESARIEFATPSQSSVAASASGEIQSKEKALEFNLDVQPVKGHAYQVKGRFHPQSEQAEMSFSSSDDAKISGELGWQWMAAEQAESAYPQLDLLLENRAASLAQGFMAEHLSGRLDTESLQLRLTVKQHESGFSIQENINLKEMEIVSGSDEAGHQKLDSQWLLALLQNPLDEVRLEFPEQNLELTETTSLETLIQTPILPYLVRMVEQPFTGLARQMGNADLNLADVQFAAGSAELNAASTEILAILGDALRQRPGLGLELAGVFDPLIDRKALQVEQIRTHIALASAAELAFQTGSQPPDFSDPVVHSVIDEFARQRLPAKVLNAFTEQFGEADVDRGVIPEGDPAAYYAALFEVLVDYAEIPQGALSTLARYRAQAVIAELAGQGVANERLLALPQPQSSVAELTGVPLTLTLRIQQEPSSSGLLEYSSPEAESVHPE